MSDSELTATQLANLNLLAPPRGRPNEPLTIRAGLVRALLDAAAERDRLAGELAQAIRDRNDEHAMCVTAMEYETVRRELEREHQRVLNLREAIATTEAKLAAAERVVEAANNLGTDGSGFGAVLAALEDYTAALTPSAKED